MPIEVPQLAQAITSALEAQSNVDVDPAIAREQIGQAIAIAIASFVQGRSTIVTGSSPSGAVTGVGIIQ